MTQVATHAVSVVMRLLDALRRELRLDDRDVDEILRAALGK
jgi:hypothetical protein